MEEARQIEKEKTEQQSEQEATEGTQTKRYTSKFLLSDEEIKALGVRACDAELFRRKHYTSCFGIETWYEALQDHTFHTLSVPLSVEEAEAIVDGRRSRLDEGGRQLLDDLRERLHSLLETEFPGGAFIKLDTRSPKDVPVYDFENEAVQQLIRDELERLYPDKQPSVRDTNMLANAIIIGTNRFMKVTNGEEALNLLIRSDRVKEDLVRALPYRHFAWTTKLILREWWDEVPERPQYEFRCFVHSNQLNAMTQYFSCCKYDDLIERKDELQQIILQFFESIKHNIDHENYVIDFYVTKNNDVKIIELNPFHNGAGASLFSWREDRERFMNGPFEFRIVEELKEDPLEAFPVRWIRFVDEFLGFRPPKGKEGNGEASEEAQDGSSNCLVC